MYFDETQFSWTRRAIELLVTVICMECGDAYAFWNLVEDNEILSIKIFNELIALLSRLALCRRSIYDRASTFLEKMLSDDMFLVAKKIGKLISPLHKGNKSRDVHLVYFIGNVKNIVLLVPSLSVKLKHIFSLSPTNVHFELPIVLYKKVPLLTSCSLNGPKKALCTDVKFVQEKIMLVPSKVSSGGTAANWVSIIECVTEWISIMENGRQRRLIVFRRMLMQEKKCGYRKVAHSWKLLM
uniref:Uncharacterized protein n=2 Tax=Nicotiana TaxID=4085 RepID=A0A1S3YYD2_TOBAC|nr:PREDICTED: uncharacterized protein LOC104214876 [Nicotiana sylvestris]XP_016456852.1 PREDICTED: uncharacterized protein LOC107780787 [Nicotiana tabacum]